MADHRAHRRRANLGLLLAGAVVIAGGFGIAVVEVLRWPKGSVWLVVGATVLLVTAIRWLTARRP
jgi:uncharacterized membrane protein